MFGFILWHPVPLNESQRNNFILLLLFWKSGWYRQKVFCAQFPCNCSSRLLWEYLRTYYECFEEGFPDNLYRNFRKFWKARENWVSSHLCKNKNEHGGIRWRSWKKAQGIPRQNPGAKIILPDFRSTLRNLNKIDRAESTI